MFRKLDDDVVAVVLVVIVAICYVYLRFCICMFVQFVTLYLI